MSCPDYQSMIINCIGTDASNLPQTQIKKSCSGDLDGFKIRYPIIQQYIAPPPPPPPSKPRYCCQPTDISPRGCTFNPYRNGQSAADSKGHCNPTRADTGTDLENWSTTCNSAEDCNKTPIPTPSPPSPPSVVIAKSIDPTKPGRFTDLYIANNSLHVSPPTTFVQCGYEQHISSDPLVFKGINIEKDYPIKNTCILPTNGGDNWWSTEPGEWRCGNDYESEKCTWKTSPLPCP